MSDATLDAGEFATWLADTRGVLRGAGDADVPCDGCTACCTSSQFVHIEPDETDALAHIPAALQFAAPGRPPGHVVLGYDEHGRCPMVGEHGCTIYEHRPRTCRMYDCRVFAATGTEPARIQPAIRDHVRRWRFEVTSPEARLQRRAVEALAAELRREQPELHATALAVAAIEAFSSR